MQASLGRFMANDLYLLHPARICAAGKGKKWGEVEVEVGWRSRFATDDLYLIDEILNNNKRCVPIWRNLRR